MINIDEQYFVKDEAQNLQKFEDMLSPNEKILYKGRPKKSAYVLEKTISFAPIAIIWAIIDISFLIVALGADDGFFAWFLIPFFALHLMPFWIWIASIIKASRTIRNTKYYITNQRLVCVKGEIQYVDSSIKLSDLTDCQLKRSSTDRLLGVGDIYLTSNECSFVMSDIHDCEFIYSKISALIEDKGEKEFYESAQICVHCGSTCDKNLKKCPNCGAGFGNKR